MVFIEETSGSFGEKIKNQPEYLHIDNWANHYCKKLADKLGYKGKIRSGIDRSPAKSINKPTTTSKSEGYSIESSYVKVNTSMIKNGHDFLEATIRGITRGIQLQELEGVKFGKRETLKYLYSFLDGQVSKFFGDERTTEKIYETVKDSGFTEEGVNRAFENYLVGNIKIEFEDNKNKQKITYPMAFERNDDYDVSEIHMNKKLQEEMDKFLFNNYQIRIGSSALEEVNPYNIEKLKTAKALETTDEKMEEIREKLNDL